MIFGLPKFLKMKQLIVRATNLDRQVMINNSNKAEKSINISAVVSSLWKI